MQLHEKRALAVRCMAAAVLVMACGRGLAAERLVLDFNPDWRFIKADPNGAQQPGSDDRQWTRVSAPHTYNDIDTFDDWSIEGHRGEQNQWGGRTWYRKTFTLPASAQGRKAYIEFEAVRQVAEVYLNGRLLGVSKSGFAPFGFDLTPYLKPDGENVLAVMCDNRFQKDPMGRARTEAAQRTANPTGAADRGPSGGARGGSLAEMNEGFNRTIPDSLDELQAYQIPWNNPHWHPAHGGIYRNVRLHIVDPLHISLPLYSFLKTEGPYVYASDASEKSARIGIEVPVQNGRSAGQQVEVTAAVRDRDGRTVMSISAGGDLAAGASETYKLTGKLDDPALWEPDYPYLYRIALTLMAGSEKVDTCEVPLGIRSVKWTIDQGFFINGHHLKLHGWGQKPTDEWPGIGNAQPNWMHYFTLNLMKEAGGNFVRWGHTAAGPAQIEATDRLGIIVDQPGVDGESDTRAAAWQLRAATFRDVIIYYRNHPSILIWEGGNQKVSRGHAAELRGYMDKYDPRGGRVYTHRRPDKIVAEFMDVQIGTEGGSDIGASTMPIFEGEYNREESPRRVWDDATPRRVGGDPCSPVVFGYVEGRGSYKLTSEQFAVNQVSQFVTKLHAPNHSGGGNWIFSDSTSGGRVPSEVCRASGEVDGVRLPKEAYYVCRAMFRDDPQVHIIGHWNYPAGTKKTVYIASNCDQVELLVKGQSLGRVGPDEFKGDSLRYLFSFPDVAWSAGEIKAVAYKGDNAVAEEVKVTAGEPVALNLTPITGPGGLLADGSDYVLIDVEAVDAQGRSCPTFERRVDFTTDGPGVWRGGYNSGIIHSINNTYLNLECGINRVSVRSTRQAGTIAVTARCPGLTTASLTIPSHPVETGFLAATPRMPMPELPTERVIESAERWLGPTAKRETLNARYVSGFSYSGPTTAVHIEQDARNGKKIYVDRDTAFTDLPAALVGADWVQATDGDSLYNAVDLMEVVVTAGTVVFIAHDDRLARPAWLTRQFQPSGMSLTVADRPMMLFQRRADRDESLTLGANTENSGATACNMYVVFVAAGRTR
jgi:beta-galactosidase